MATGTATTQVDKCCTDQVELLPRHGAAVFRATGGNQSCPLDKGCEKKAKDVHLLSEDDIFGAESVIKVLGPIKTNTTILCDEKTPTVSMIHPLKEMLIQQMKVSDDDIMLVKEVKTAIPKDLDARFGNNYVCIQIQIYPNYKESS